MRWPRHAARMGKMINAYKKPEGRKSLEDVKKKIQLQWT
jgi:hypothetical protein